MDWSFSWIGYGFKGQGTTVWFPAWPGRLSVFHRVHIGTGILPASYPLRSGSSFFGGKTVRAWSWRFTLIYLFIYEGKSACKSAPTPTLSPYSFILFTGTVSHSTNFKHSDSLISDSLTVSVISIGTLRDSSLNARISQFSVRCALCMSCVTELFPTKVPFIPQINSKNEG